MAKPTSKSASETNGTSSPSGTSVPTDGTASPSRAKKPTGRFDHVVARVKNLSRDQLRQSLVAAGIITENGELAAKYRRPRKR
jgi:hypothetical protein